MDITIPLPDALQWAEGMPLSPQHFQQNDIYWQQQLWHCAASLQPFYWGVLALALEGTSLQGGLLRIKQLQAVMPDGLAVQVPGNHPDEVLQLDLNDAAIVWPEPQVLKVHLCVPMRREGAASSNSSIRRFASLLGQEEVDENTGSGRMAVGRLRPLLELLPANQVSAKHVSFPLLEVRCDAAKNITLTDYHPPLLRALAASYLGEQSISSRLVRMVRDMREKAKELIGDRSDDDHAASLSPEAQQQIYAARMLGVGLSAYEIEVRTELAHPYQLYLGLARLVGQVACIGNNPLPPVLPEYRHDDCLPGFRAGLAFLRSRLDKLQIDFESLFFDRVSSAAFARTLPDDLLADTVLVEIKPALGQGAEHVGQWLAGARIAGDELMPVLAQRRLPGAAVRLIDHSQLQGLQVKSEALIYEIRNKALELDGKLLPLFSRGGRLMIQGGGEPSPPTAIVLHRARLKGGSKEVSVMAPRSDGTTLAGPAGEDEYALNDPASILEEGEANG
jgi:type VI secretion system protein ImpJ